MPSYEVNVDGRRLRVWYSFWSGRETVHHGDRLLSTRRNLLDPVTHHSFCLDPVPDSYELRNAEPFGHLVRRNGVTLLEHHHAVVRYLIAVGLVAGTLLVVAASLWLAGVAPGWAGRIFEWAPTLGILGGMPVAWGLKRRLVGGARAGPAGAVRLEQPTG
jgi:hypothetical protein